MSRASLHTNYIVVREGGREVRLAFTSRDWKLLCGPCVPEGPPWMLALGFHSGGGVAEGLRIGVECVTERARALRTTVDLLRRVEADRRLLDHDYAVTVTPHPVRPLPEQRLAGGIICAFTLGGRRQCLCVKPGHCYLDPTLRGIEVLDLRDRAELALDPPFTLRIRRRTRPTAWTTQLPLLRDFLEAGSSGTVDVYNHHR